MPSWAAEIPYQIKKIAVRDACRAFTAGKVKAKSTGVPFELHFRKRRSPKQGCFIPKSALTGNGIYPTLSGKVCFAEPLPANHSDGRFVCENGRWFVVVSFEEAISRAENQGRLIALDPGVRTFLTYFSEDSCGSIGRGCFGRIVRLCQQLDDLISRASKTTARRRYRMKKAMARMRWKIRDLVDELHHQAANFLVKNFDIILLPTFETSEMAAKARRKIRAKSVRSMLTFAFFRFKQYLKHVAARYGKHVELVDEAYTSKTVSWTGEVIQNLGGRKKIKSKIDGRVLDRDLNGARGIFLRALADLPWLRAYAKLA